MNIEKDLRKLLKPVVIFLWITGTNFNHRLCIKSLTWWKFHSASTADQQISTKVAKACFSGISIPTNAQDVLQRHDREVYICLLLCAFSSCTGKMSRVKQMFTKATVNRFSLNFTSVERSVDTITQDKFDTRLRITCCLFTGEITDRASLCHMVKILVVFPE